MRIQRTLALGAALVCAYASHAQNAESWKIGPFIRSESVNPVIAPRPESAFIDPILKTPSRWETLHTFNPAAIVRNNKVCVLYRAEDDSGAMEIGGHTSRRCSRSSMARSHWMAKSLSHWFRPTLL